jgi:hypothetical protein
VPGAGHSTRTAVPSAGTRAVPGTTMSVASPCRSMKETRWAEVPPRMRAVGAAGISSVAATICRGSSCGSDQIRSGAKVGGVARAPGRAVDSDRCTSVHGSPVLCWTVAQVSSSRVRSWARTS